MTRTALIVLNPRDIPYCMDALRAVAVPKCWVSYMPEPSAARHANEAIQATSFDRYAVISDDCQPAPGVFEMVTGLHDHGHPVTTGYSNLDATLPFVNLCSNKLTPPPAGLHSYVFMTKTEVKKSTDPVLTTFTGLSFTLMSRSLWLRFPLRTTKSGGQMDYQLSYELGEAGISIMAARDAMVHHVKDEFGVYPDRAPEKKLLVGERPPSMSWTDLDLS